LKDTIKSSDYLIWKLAQDLEHNLITQRARIFASTSLGRIEDGGISRKHGKSFLWKERRERALSLLAQFPEEVWDVPALTALYLGEACQCYVNGEYIACLAMCQATTESFLKGLYRAAKRPLTRAVAAERGAMKRRKGWNELLEEFTALNLTSPGKRYLNWLANLRNTLLHVGTDQDYAKAIRLATTPIILDGKTTPFPAILPLCKIALSVTIEFVGSNSVNKEKTHDLNHRKQHEYH
jgi:hypothetical protein